MTALVVVLVLAAVVVAGLAVAWPLLTAHSGPGPAGPSGPEDPATAERREVEDELQRSLQAIKEIQFDRASGHLSQEDFAALDADERARAIELMRRRDALAATDGPPPAAAEDGAREETA